MERRKVDYFGKEAICYSVFDDVVIEDGKLVYKYLFVIRDAKTNRILYSFPYTGTVPPINDGK